MRKSAVFLVLAALLGACGGGGGSNAPAPGFPGAGAQPSVSGDMLALAASRGWNYQGTLQAQRVTFTLYADPPDAGVTRLVALSVPGTQVDATVGSVKQAAFGLVNGSNGYAVTSYTIYNADTSIFAAGSLPAGSLLVPSTLTQGQSFTPYPGMSATVTFVGAVPGADACPTQAMGATVTYTFVGQTYRISYVPGCGITQYVGNHDETFTLTSIASYPQLGVQTARRRE